MCGGVYGPDLDGVSSCVLCSCPAPILICRARRCPACPERAALGLPPNPAVTDCRHRSTERAPHCLDAYHAETSRRPLNGNGRRAMPSAPRTGRCLARNCRPCRAAETVGRPAAPIVDYNHSKNRRARIAPLSVSVYARASGSGQRRIWRRSVRMWGLAKRPKCPAPPFLEVTAHGRGRKVIQTPPARFVRFYGQMKGGRIFTRPLIFGISPRFQPNGAFDASLGDRACQARDGELCAGPCCPFRGFRFVGRSAPLGCPMLWRGCDADGRKSAPLGARPRRAR